MGEPFFTLSKLQIQFFTLKNFNEWEKHFHHLKLKSMFVAAQILAAFTSPIRFAIVKGF
jgi:hypothetical protein